MDIFFWMALIAGTATASAAGPIGCFVIWRKMAYFGDAIAHAGLLGVAFAITISINPLIGIFLACTAVALGLSGLLQITKLPADASLGILSHGSLAVGLVLLGLTAQGGMDLNALLFGDILALTQTDVMISITVAAAVLGTLFLIRKPLLAATVSEELAAAEGLNPKRANLIFLILVAALTATAMKFVGVLLVAALIIIPASAARNFSRNPESMILSSAAIGALAVIVGLSASFEIDIPTGPAIVVAALILFLLSILVKAISARKQV